jgi:hypothetical protein
MARYQDTDDAEDGKDVAGHRTGTEDNDELAPIGGAAPRRPRVAADEDDTEGHLYGSGPSTQGEVFPHPSDNPHGDR